MPVSDYIKTGYNDGEYGYFFGDKLYAKPPMKLPLIEHILYERDVVCISSAPGIGKTMLALQLLCNMTSGTPFLGTYEVYRPLNVLYIQTEGDRAETLERLDLMKQGLPINNARWAHLNLPGIKFNAESEFVDFLDSIKICGLLYDVIIVDPLYTTVEGSLNSDEVATNWIRNMRTLKALYDCAVIVLHHDAKDIYSEGVPIDRGNNVTYGSVFWQAFFNHNFKLKKRKDVYYLEGGKQRSGKIIDRVEMTLETEPLLFTSLGDTTSGDAFVVLKALQVAEGRLSAKDLLRITKVSKSSLYRILKRLEDNNQICVDHTPHKLMYKIGGINVPKSDSAATGK